MIKRTLKRYLQKCSDCSDHILSQEDLNGEIPGNSSSLDTFQELLSRARAAGEYTTDAGRHGQHFYVIVSIAFSETQGGDFLSTDSVAFILIYSFAFFALLIFVGFKAAKKG